MRNKRITTKHARKTLRRIEIRAARTSVFYRVRACYKASGNKELYEKFQYKFNSCDKNDTAMMDKLVEEVLRKVNLVSAFTAADENTKTYYRNSFRILFTSGFETGRNSVCDKGLLMKMAWKQNFVCPVCECRLDPNIDSGPEKITIDHWVPYSELGDDVDAFDEIYGTEISQYAAMHAECNQRKGTNFFCA